MDRKELIEREERQGRIAGIVGISAVVSLFVLPAVLGLNSNEFAEIDSDSTVERLQAFEAARDDIFLSTLIQAVCVAAYAAPLAFLFLAAVARSEGKMYRGLIGLAIAGPVLAGAAVILNFVSFDTVAGPFLDSAPPGAESAEEAAEDALRDELTTTLGTAFGLAGTLSLSIATVYTAFHAMKTGLLTRFLGALGIAAGAGFLLIPGAGPLFFALWIVAISLLIARWWFGALPPAWTTGEAVPWPKPGEGPVIEPEELADPSEFAGDDAEDADEPDTGASTTPKTRASAKKRKKRKR